MRRASAVIAILLLAGAAVAHGVHDLKGVLDVEEQRVRIEIAQDDGHSENRRCLRLLDELQVLDGKGRRLVGTEHEEAGHCTLEYEVRSGTTELSLQLRSSGRGPRGNERLILQPWREGAVSGSAIVLSGRGNVEAVALKVPRDLEGGSASGAGSDP